ncbi:MAG: VOC family protein [Dehalococcoidales bacterium]|nr:VOC family protein [Dehalococcoidales bacterium]
MPEYTFDHIHLMSPDPVKTAEFYQKQFGAILVNSRDFGNGRVSIYLNLGGIRLLVSTATDPKTVGLHHFGIKTDHLNEAVDKMKAEGVTFTKEITEIRPHLQISFLQAPENVPIELMEGNG